MVTNRSRHPEAEKLRKKWNRAAWAEQRRQDIVVPMMRSLVERSGLPEKKWLHFLELTQRTYFPARQHLYHPAIHILRNRMWERVKYELFGTGYFKSPWDIERNEWNEAKARAKGYIHARVHAEYAKAFKWSDDSPSAYSVVVDQALVDDITARIVRNIRAAGLRLVSAR
ncbi:hypothetical protein NA57DRAFT_79520 [Rhizodiscina lignyota]|uniref:Uncharacterized protein n=1 Tax=Rhizodiscina lignyota TaxID=1504668 RepID=A0A9P4I9T4_9PEZI|nr:hypothetical protein NA57DRAFT_79520 [Rhizodiscina lignyota]